ncbi:NAD(P)-dependent dehydrogenase (short-subunit alcohol dehydrogenase family) [Variovorax boronicumulans]|uniref:NAD(P)-dependent dehydrogenase (Short-subunit alcohol dehydrogenase family) n=1 Tax=Variovorax boronicumulans TaxID=436515 RepID=A0AAW8CT29_9BURK|nr:glucose 1-dehydrogenase [Variovorax boronicumulans]MDP9890986.1 NAD(P)-dependent dehydrogenase (short-subunit alcohol dehydrogenase family) [Variovorax boronicumulans]MDQ0051053.1 NAD(P)-dependent dehydrogenase (short-subunit alcohol dehydrogenase family) [Variovorax boronicumulans]
MQRLSGKVAVITGGNSGIGLACAQAFAAEGARVVIVGRRQDAVDTALASIGTDAMGFVGDVADLAMHDRLLAAVEARFGAIDIYLANAGTAILEPSSAVTVNTYDVQFATNTRAVFFGVTKALPFMRDGGSIILTSSIAGSKVMDNHAVYAGSKAAIEAFARNWALELKDRRIRVNVLSPGPVDTPILAKLGITESARPEFDKSMAAAIPLGRLGQPNDLAQAALFLASDDSVFVTGVNLKVDGGMALT